MTEIPQWVLNIASMSAPLFTGIGTVVFARWRYKRNRQFSTISDQKRIDALTRIAVLEKAPAEQENVIRALYASIGMHFPNKLNKLTLAYINEKGLAYDHSGLNHFLKSVRLFDINTKENHYEFSNKKYFWRLADLWFVLILVTLVLIPGAYLAFKLAPTVKDTRQIVGYCISVIFLGGWTSLYIGFLNQFQHCISSKAFYKDFGPWLKLKLKIREDETTKEDESSNTPLPTEDIAAQTQPILATTISAKLHQWLSHKWKI
jgi:hypothetical protein